MEIKKLIQINYLMTSDFFFFFKKPKIKTAVNKLRGDIMAHSCFLFSVFCLNVLPANK